MYIHMIYIYYVCMYVCMHVYMYIYIYIYTQIAEALAALPLGGLFRRRRLVHLLRRIT